MTIKTVFNPMGGRQQGENLSDWIYEKDGSTITLLSYIGENVYVNVPTKNTQLNDYNSYYTYITPFYNNQNIVSVDLKNVPFVNNSMAYTFNNCSNLVSVNNINPNVTSMIRAFNNCRNFNQPITIPNSVTNMFYTFSNCFNFNQPITIPNSVTSMIGIFNNCRNFNQPITIPNSVTVMTSAFNHCFNFNQPITIPNSVTSMTDIFHYCQNFNQSITIRSIQVQRALNCFSSVQMSESSPVIFPLRYINNVNTVTRNSLVSDGYAVGTGVGNWANNSTQNCNIYFQDFIAPYYSTYTGSGSEWILNVMNAQVTNVIVPSSIYTYANYPCRINGTTCYKAKTNLAYVTIFAPWVNSNMFNAFRGCTNLVNVIIAGSNVTNLHASFYGTSVGKNSPFNFTITSPRVTEIVNMFTFNNTYTKTVHLYKTYSNGINTSTYNQFKANSQLNNNSTTKFYINNLTDEHICYDNLHQISTTDNTITKYYYDRLSHVTEYIAPSSLNIRNYPDIDGNTDDFYYGANTFNNCRNLISIDLKNHPIVDGRSTFSGCDRLTYINNLKFSNSAMDMSRTFHNCSNFNQPIPIPNSVTNMAFTFYNCQSFNSEITIPNSVTNMVSTFYNCRNFNQPITIPNNVTNTVSTFSNCYNFNQSITIPNSVTNIYNTFRNSGISRNIKIFSNQIANAQNCFNSTSARKNVFIPYTYTNGELTTTYNSFKTAGYINTLNDGETLINGVYMYNIANYPEE